MLVCGGGLTSALFPKKSRKGISEIMTTKELIYSKIDHANKQAIDSNVLLPLHVKLHPQFQLAQDHD